MTRLLFPTGFALCIIAASALPGRAADPLPPELNLIPRDSAMVLSINVADLLKANKQASDLLAKEGIFKNFEKQNGFGPASVARISVVMPTIAFGHDQTEPFVVVTFAKPYDLAKLLDTWGGMTEAEMQDREMHEMSVPPFTIENKPLFKGKEYFPPEKFPSPAPKPRFKEDFDFKKSDIPKKAPEFPAPKPPLKEDFDFKKPQSRIELAPRPREQNFVLLAQGPKEVVREPEEPVEAKPRKRDLSAGYYFLQSGRGLLIPINERTICVAFGVKGNGNSIIALMAQSLRRKDDGPLAIALQAASQHAVVAGLNVPMVRNFTAIDRRLNALPIHSLLAAKSATMTVDFGEELTLRLYVDCKDEAAAKKAKDLLGAYLTIGKETLAGVGDEIARDAENKIFAKLIGLLGKSLDEAKLSIKENGVEMKFTLQTDAVLLAAVAEATQKVREAAERTKAQNNLKQMALAVHNYNDSMGRMPFPGVGDAQSPPFGGGLPNRNPNLSWRVAILPYIEQQNLYNQFHFNEPWDSDHNKKLIPQMPKLYEIPGSNAPKGQTYYRVFNQLNDVNQITQITDGTSNTLMIVEAGDPVIWTKPDDFPATEKKLPKLGGHFKGGFNAAWCDGSVRFIKDTVNKLQLYYAITPNGGEVIGNDWDK
jgi:prepilin-type processing-associated H-X9-DG protein